MPEIKTDVPAEIIGEAEPNHDAHSRLIAVAAVVTTLLAASTGFLQASALRTHDEADARAERLGTLASAAAAGNGDQARVQIERFRLLQQEQRQEANADDFRDYAGQSSAALEASRWHGVVQNTQRDTEAIAKGQHLLATCPASSDNGCIGARSLPVICFPSAQTRTCGTRPGEGGWYSPEQDPAFPTRYQEAAQRESYFLLAQRDAANELADAGEGHFVHFAAALTMFAVAVFLFGYSLTPQGRKRRRLFAFVATGFALAGGLWASVHAVTGMPAQPAEAAAAYADGKVALDDNDFVIADRLLTRATQLRPKFVDAWTELARAKYLEGIPDAYADNEGTQIAGVPAMQAAIAADRQAIDAGSESPTIREELGANLLYVGLLTHRDELIRESRSVSADAAARFIEQLAHQRHPGIYLLNSDFNTAEADLVEGSSRTWAEYRSAEQHMLKLENEVSGEAAVAGALTDLNLIAQVRPKLSGEIRWIADQLVSAASGMDWGAWNLTANGGVPSGHDRARLARVEIQPDPGHMQFTIDGATQLNLDRDLVSVQWEYEDPVNRNWEVLPDISGPISSPAGITLAADGGNSYRSSNPSFLGQTTVHTCLPAGRYRALVWVNGRLAGQSPPTSSTWDGLQAAGFRGVDVSFCKPANWHGVYLGANADFFTSPDRADGATILVLPKRALGGGSVTELMRHVVDGLSNRARGLFPNAKAVGSDQLSYFMNYPGAREQLWRFDVGGSGMGALLSAAGVAPDQELYVALVFGSADANHVDGALTRMNNILLSFSRV